jgi:hypothetical protein
MRLGSKPGPQQCTNGKKRLEGGESGKVLAFVRLQG